MTRAQLSDAGFSVEPAVYERLGRFVELLLDENSRLNLTAIRTPERVWPLHICDSLAVLRVLRERGAKTVVDLGTGGGVPGVPMACAATDVRFVLIDATRKKIDAVRRIVAALGLSNVEAVWGRAESLAQDAPLRAAADFVVARAVAKLPELIATGVRLLRPAGWLACMKALPALDEEIASATPIARRSGMRLLEKRSYSLPPPHGERALVIYERAT